MRVKVINWKHDATLNQLKDAETILISDESVRKVVTAFKFEKDDTWKTVVIYR